ncbi:MAG: P-loop NTPase fold protein [Anaerolineales bacterium]
MKMKFIPDFPITGLLFDRLGLKGFSSRIWEAIQNTDPPFVFGLIGDWGSGKTSALHILEDQISKANNRQGMSVFCPHLVQCLALRE